MDVKITIWWDTQDRNNEGWACHCDVKGWDFAELDRQAYDHYTTEKAAGGLFV